jgi:hypothetical protein
MDQTTDRTGTARVEASTSDFDERRRSVDFADAQRNYLLSSGDKWMGIPTRERMYIHSRMEGVTLDETSRGYWSV